MSYQFHSLDVSKKVEHNVTTLDHFMMRVALHSTKPDCIHYFKVPAYSVVDVFFQSTEHHHFIRLRFELPNHNMYIHGFRQRHDNTFVEAPLDKLPLKPAALYPLIQSIHFFGRNHRSFIVHSNNRKKYQNLKRG